MINRNYERSYHEKFEIIFGKILTFKVDDTMIKNKSDYNRKKYCI